MRSLKSPCSQNHQTIFRFSWRHWTVQNKTQGFQPQMSLQCQNCQAPEQRANTSWTRDKQESQTLVGRIVTWPWLLRHMLKPLCKMYFGFEGSPVLLVGHFLKHSLQEGQPTNYACPGGAEALPEGMVSIPGGLCCFYPQRSLFQLHWC